MGAHCLRRTAIPGTVVMWRGLPHAGREVLCVAGIGDLIACYARTAPVTAHALVPKRRYMPQQRTPMKAKFAAHSQPMPRVGDVDRDCHRYENEQRQSHRVREVALIAGADQDAVEREGAPRSTAASSARKSNKNGSGRGRTGRR